MSFAAPVHPMPLTVMMKMNPSTQTEQEKNDMIRAMSLGPKHRALNTVRYETDTLSKIVLSRMVVVLTHSWHASVSLKIQERTDLQKVLDTTATNGAFTKGVITSSGHVWMDTQLSLVQSSLFGLSVAFGLALVVLLAATGSLVVRGVEIPGLYRIICPISKCFISI